MPQDSFPGFPSLITVPPADAERSPTEPPPPVAPVVATPDPPRQPAVMGADRPTPERVFETQKYFISLRADLIRQVTTIEAFLGFVTDTENLSVRVAKIEQFLGLKG